MRSYQLYFTTRDKVASAVQSFFMENAVNCDTSWKLELGVFKLHICIGQDVLDLVVGVLLGNSICVYIFVWLMEAADLKQICCPQLTTCMDYSRLRVLCSMFSVGGWEKDTVIVN